MVLWVLTTVVFGCMLDWFTCELVVGWCNIVVLVVFVLGWWFAADFFAI